MCPSATLSTKNQKSSYTTHCAARLGNMSAGPLSIFFGCRDAARMAEPASSDAAAIAAFAGIYLFRG